MKVTAVATWFPTEKAPASGSFIVKDLHALQGAGVEVRLVHLLAPRLDDGSRRLDYQGIPVTRLPFNPFSPLDLARCWRALRAALAGSDLVHSMAMSALAPVALAKPRSLPWVHTEHWSGLTNPGTLDFKLRAARPVVLGLEKLPDVVTAVCPYLSAPLKAVRRAKPTVEVPCVVEPVAELTPRRVPVSEPWNLISVGGLVERKDPIFALRVVAELARRGRRATLTWVGSGPLGDSAREFAARRGLELRLTGPLSYTGVSTELSRADLFLGPTHGDNFYVSCAEAILHGRPVVVGAAGGHPEYMRDFVGEALEGHEVGAYADAIERQLLGVVRGNPAHRGGLPSAEDIAGSIGQAFSAATVGSSYRQVYQAVLHHRLSDLDALPSWRGW